MDSETLVDDVPLPEVDVRPPPTGLTLLLPVWGYRFILQCLEFCLPTLLAPGNIPAVAVSLPTRLVMLSREGDEDLIRSHPTWLALQRYCTTEIAFIDDLITDGNHTATITLAFARAIRQTREAMTDTCFVFLMSDYLFADGALRTLVKHFVSGISGIVAGNFQIIAEEAAPELQDSINPTTRTIVLPARDLIAWSLDHLHPATTANFVNFGLNHNAHTNRLLWRVDANTVIGRFYLMHPIGIRPELTDFVIGSSLDYSFIPEMCPSGNVVTLTDSDDYFVVEMQPRHHERANLRVGPVQEAELAVSLAEWTTPQHRGNIAQTIVYHAGEIPPSLPDVVAEADRFTQRITALLATTPPQPFRNHPYWIGSIASNRMQTGQALTNDDWRFLLGEALPSGGIRGIVWAIRRAIFGAAPDVTRLHTRWPDYSMPRAALQQVLAENGRLLLVADQPSRFGHWLAAITSNIYTLEWDRLRHVQPMRPSGELPEWYLSLLESFDGCFVVVTEPMLDGTGKVLERLAPLLKAQGQMSIMILNDRPFHNAAAFREVYARASAELLDHSSWTLEAHYIPSSRLRWVVYRASDSVLARARDAYRGAPVMLPAWGMLLVALGCITYLLSLGVRSKTKPPHGLWSSVFLMLRRTERSGRDFRGDVPAWAAPSWMPVARVGGFQQTPEEAPAALSDGEAESVVEPLSSYMAHAVAGRLLSGRHDVALYGLDEAASAQIGMYNVKQLAIYDPRSRMPEARMRLVAGIRLPQVQFHDILRDPLSRVHDSICSLGILAYVSHLNEDRFVDNLARSLARRQDILVLGCPTNASAAEEDADGPGDLTFGASEDRSGASIQGGSNGSAQRRTKGTAYRHRQFSRTPAQLKALAERFFENVFLFSITEGVLEPGASAKADYVIALCCSKKQ